MSRAPRFGGAGAALLALALLVPAGARAQALRVELSAGAAVGNYTETEAGLDVLPEPSFGVLAELWLTESLATYAGFTRSAFGCEEGFCTNRDVSLTSQGVVVGGRWSPGWPWVRAGVGLQGLTVDAMGAEDSGFDMGLALEVAGGLDIPVASGFRVRPGVRYLRHDAATALGGGHVALLALEVGVSMRLLEF